MCKFIGKSNERILCKLSKSEILRLYSIVHVAMETTKTSNFTCQSKFFISIFFNCQVTAFELQPFPCHDLANDTYSQTAKTVFCHLKHPGETFVGHKLVFCHLISSLPLPRFEIICDLKSKLYLTFTFFACDTHSNEPLTKQGFLQ